MISTTSRHLAGAGLLAAALACIGPLTAAAGPAADSAAAAEAALSAGDTAAAIAAMDAAEDAIWKALPLTFRVSVFADSVEGFGKYTPRGSSAFRSGETVTVYLEPVGYGFASAGGMETVTLTPSLEIRTPGGLILGKSDDVGKLEWSGRAKSREVHAAVSVALPELKPGSYELLLVLVDDASKKTATVTLPFTIAE